MAESIAESIAYVDAIANEHTDSDRVEEGRATGAREMAKQLGIDFPTAFASIGEAPCVPEGADPMLKGLLHGLVFVGFLYGVRWEQQRGTP